MNFENEDFPWRLNHSTIHTYNHSFKSKPLCANANDIVKTLSTSVFRSKLYHTLAVYNFNNKYLSEVYSCFIYR